MTRAYRVHLASRPSPGLTYYEGHVDLDVNDDPDDDEIARRAIDKLGRTNFRERSAACWRVLRVERRT